jgi:hypothetical protein
MADDSLPDLSSMFNRDLPDGVSVGSPIADFTFSGKRKAFWAVLGVACVVGGIALLTVAWLDEDRMHRSKATAISFLVATSGGILLFNAFRVRRPHAWVGTTAIALLENDKLQSAGWGEIVTLWDSKITSANSMGVTPLLLATVRGEDRVLTAECHDSKRLVFKSFLGNIARLAKIMKRETLAHQLTAAMAVIDAKGAVPFGSLLVSSEGLSQIGGSMLTWPEVKDVVNKDGVFTVSTPGKWLSWVSCSQGEIPNLHVLMCLLDKYRNRESKDALKGGTMT